MIYIPLNEIKSKSIFSSKKWQDGVTLAFIELIWIHSVLTLIPIPRRFSK